MNYHKTPPTQIAPEIHMLYGFTSLGHASKICLRNPSMNFTLGPHHNTIDAGCNSVLMSLQKGLKVGLDPEILLMNPTERKEEKKNTQICNCQKCEIQLVTARKQRQVKSISLSSPLESKKLVYLHLIDPCQSMPHPFASYLIMGSTREIAKEKRIAR